VDRVMVEAVDLKAVDLETAEAVGVRTAAAVN
jgi:hypothetical protein